MNEKKMGQKNLTEFVSKIDFIFSQRFLFEIGYFYQENSDHKKFSKFNEPKGEWLSC